MQLILIVAASILGWIGCALANIRLYRATFNNDGYGDRDLIVLLGPIGTFMLGLCAGLMGYTKLCNGLGKRWSKASTFALLFAVLIPWVGSGAANYVWNNRLFKTNNEDDMGRDFIVALGPIGSFMLFLCWIVSLVINTRDSAGDTRAA
jgi:hypothetical protein